MPDSPLTLKEYTPVEIGRGDLPSHVGDELWEKYGSKINVEFPTRKTQGNWVLTNQGYGGHIRIDSEWSFELEAKTPVRTILGMLEYAYDLDSFDFLDGLYDADSLSDYFDEIAHTLAKNVVTRQQKGLYKSYVDREEQTSVVKGQIDFSKTAREPWKPNPHIKHREITVDVEDNQILLWTLQKILSSDAPSESTLQTVRRAYRPMASEVSLTAFRAEDCVGREYRRLNHDYEALHALCHLVLDTIAPTRSVGEKRMIPFIVDMARLYESFVYEWLDQHLPSQYSVKDQEQVGIGDSKRAFDVDLVFYSGSDAIAVADTKYKTPSQPSTEDISQVISYAEARGVEKAFLVYPETLDNPIETTVGDVQVEALTFGIEGDLDDEGELFVSEFERAVMGGIGLPSA